MLDSGDSATTMDPVAPASAPQDQAPSLDQIVKERVKQAPPLTIDPIIQGIVQRNQTVDAASRSVSQGIDKNPEEYAKYVRLSKVSGMDPEMLFTDPAMKQEAERRGKMGGINLDSLVKTNPRTVAFLSNPENAAVSYDDISNMSAMELAYTAVDKTLRGLKSIGAGLSTDFTANTLGVLAASIGKTAEDMNTGNAKSDAVNQGIAALRSDNPYATLLNLAQIPGREALLEMGRRTGMGQAGAETEKTLLGMQQIAQEYGDKFTGTTGREGLGEAAVYSGLRSLGQVAPSVLLSVMTRNPEIALNMMAAQTGGQTYGKARAGGLDANKSLEYAGQDAAAEYFTEMIPVKYLMKDDVFKANLMKSIVNFQIKEGLTEQAATAWQDLNEWVNLNPDKPFSEYLAARPNAALSTAIATTVAGGGQVAVAQFGSRLNSGAAQDTKAFFDALANGVNESKLHQRLPEKTREFIANVKESGDIKDVFIDAGQFNKYFQSKDIDPQQAANELLGEGGAKQLNDAATVGGDLVIPLEAYAEKMAGSEHHSGLANDLRLRQGDMSENEIKLYQSNTPEDEKRVSDMVVQAHEQMAGDVSTKAIYDDVYSQAIAAGVPPSQADTWSTLEAARYRTRAARLGVDAIDLWQKDGGLQITRPGTDGQVPEGAQELNQDTPEFRNWFGNSRAVDETGKPLRVYHGTRADIEQFQSGQSLQNMFFFTPDAKLASMYAGEGEGANVVPTYLSMQNPLTIDINQDYNAQTFKEAQQAGHDGIIAYRKFQGKNVPEVHIVFSPNQIKSALGNSGAYDPDSANILHQSEKPDEDAAKRADTAYTNFMKAITSPTSEFTKDVGLQAFANSLRDRVNQRVERTKMLTEEAGKRGVYLWDAGDLVMSPKTGQTYKIIGRTWQEPIGKNPSQRAIDASGPKYFYESTLPEGTEGWSKGMFNAPQAHKSMFKVGGEFNQNNRGMVQLAEGFRRITLLENADLSTFIHELGHTWLEELQRDAKSEGAPQQLIEDWDTVRGWLGIAPEEAIPVNAHEQFARGVEAYFMEGNSPSPMLSRVFHKIKAWMQSVYKSLTQLDVRLNADVRSVFDRMIALDDEIDRARAASGFVQMFSTPEEAGMTEAEFHAYAVATATIRQEQQDELVASVARELAREQTRQWRENRTAVREEVRLDASANKTYQAIWVLARGSFMDGTVPDEPIKLSKQGIIDVAGEDALKLLTPTIMKSGGWVYSAEGGVHPDVVAKMFGFRTGKQLIKAMTTTVPMSTFVEEKTDEVMKERYGDPMDAGQLATKADEVVHTDRQGDLLAIELDALRRKKSEVDSITAGVNRESRRNSRQARASMMAPVPVAILKDVAYNEISGTLVGKLDPQQYLYAEVRSGKQATDYAAKGDYASAAEAKQRQILNFYLYREALRAKKETDAKIRKAYSYTKDSVRARIGKAGQEWLEQMDSILDRYSFATMPQLQKARSMADWAKAIEQATGEAIAIAPDVLDESRRTSFKELTVDQLRAVSDTMASIAHVAKKITQVTRNGQAYEMAEITGQLADAVRHNIEGNPMPETDKALSDASRVFKMTKGFLDSNLRPEKLFERMDGGKSGVWHDLFWNPAVDAQTQRDDLRYMVMSPLAVLNESMPEDRKARMNESVDIESMNRSISRRTVIGIALNVGNASNRSKLQRGGMWFGDEFTTINDEQLAEILDTMDENDWKLVQATWTSIGQLYPLLDDLNRRAVGLPLVAIEASPVETKFGTLVGGYWPAVADPRHSKVGEQQENSESASITAMFAPRYPKAATTHSFREERTEAAYPLQFDWERVLANHVNKAITDIAYHEWVKQSRRLLENQNVKKSIQNTLGEEIYRSLEEWLVHQVIPIHGGYSANQSVDTLANTLLSNTVVAALGFKAATAIGNMVVAPVQAAHQIRPDYMVGGIAKFLRNPLKAIEGVNSVSGEMRHRFEHYEQTFNTIMRELEGKDTLRSNIARWAMSIHLYVDKVTSTALWAGKYQQEIDAGRSVEEAMRLSDKMIRTTQTAGAPKDLSSFERDPRYRIFKMFIGPMIIMQNEMRGSVAGKGAKALISPEVWATMFATWIIPAMLFELAAGRGPGDDEEWWQWALRKVLLYPAQTVPFVREAASAAESAIIGREGITRSNPISDALISVVRSTAKALSDDASMGDITKAFVRTMGTLFGLPSSQAVITGEFLGDVASGEYEPQWPEDLRYLFYRRSQQ